MLQEEQLVMVLYVVTFCNSAESTIEHGMCRRPRKLRRTSLQQPIRLHQVNSECHVSSTLRGMFRTRRRSGKLLRSAVDEVGLAVDPISA